MVDERSIHDEAQVSSRQKFTKFLATYIFSLMMLRARTHKASCCWIVPDGPYMWKVHFVTLQQTNRKEQDIRGFFTAARRLATISSYEIVLKQLFFPSILDL
jgi:hypothetical protein